MYNKDADQKSLIKKNASLEIELNQANEQIKILETKL